MKVYTDTGKAILEAVEDCYSKTNVNVANVFYLSGIWEALNSYQANSMSLFNLPEDQKLWFALMVAEQHSVDIEDILDKVFDDGFDVGRESAKEYYRNLFY